jgi:hypothetical protein
MPLEGARETLQQRRPGTDGSSVHGRMATDLTSPRRR